MDILTLPKKLQERNFKNHFEFFKINISVLRFRILIQQFKFELFVLVKNFSILIFIQNFLVKSTFSDFVLRLFWLFQKFSFMVSSFSLQFIMISIIDITNNENLKHIFLIKKYNEKLKFISQINKPSYSIILSICTYFRQTLLHSLLSICLQNGKDVTIFRRIKLFCSYCCI